MTYQTRTHASQQPLVMNRVLRNTYALLGMTLIFSGVVAWGSLLLGLPHPGLLLTLVGFYGLYFLTQYYRDSAMGVLTAFLFTGFLGYTLGPMLGMVLNSVSNGYAIIGAAFAATGITFVSLSLYILTTRKNFSYMGGLLFIGAILSMLTAFASLAFPSLSLMIITSALFALISAGYILYHTSEIIHGGETNYIMATLALFVSIYNLFLSLLRIIMMFAGQRD